MPYFYCLYGLTVEVPFPIPDLDIVPEKGVPDVIVCEGTLPLRLSDATASDSCWQAAPGTFLFMPGARIGRIIVHGGSRVIISRGPAASNDVLAYYLITVILAIGLHQRGCLVLHANAAATSSGAVMLAGPSGAGKSTTLSALLARGYAMLADDVTVLKRQQDGTVVALPGLPFLHLTSDAATGLGQNLDGFPRYHWRRM